MEQQAFECAGCDAKYVLTLLDAGKARRGFSFCPYCGRARPKKVKPADLEDERQLKLTVAGLR